VNVKLRVLGSLVGIWDTSEILDLTSPCLFIKALDISTLTHIKRWVDEAFIERDIALLMNLSAELAVFGVRWDKGDEANLAREWEELSDFRYSPDILSSVLSSEAKIFV
jgi:hypothetical protein